MVHILCNDLATMGGAVSMWRSSFEARIVEPLMLWKICKRFATMHRGRQPVASLKLGMSCICLLKVVQLKEQ